MDIKRILVGVDFSPESALAVEQAMEIARLSGADLVLAHATYVPDRIDTAGVPESTAQAMDHYQDLLDAHLKQNRARLSELRERISGQGVEVSQMVLDGYADHALPKAARELSADLVAIGTHGRTGFKRFLLGSVAERTVRLTSDTSVLVARPKRNGHAGFRRLLVPTDFSARAEEALEVAMVLAAPGARIDVLHCWQVPALLVTHYLPQSENSKTLGPLVNSIQESARAQGDNLISRHHREGVTLSFETLEAPPAKGIRERAEDGYDLIVIGSHGRRGASRVLLGSVAEMTVRHAPCSVVAVHGEAAD